MDETSVDVAIDYLRRQCLAVAALRWMPVDKHMVGVVLDALEAERVARNVAEGWRVEWSHLWRGAAMSDEVSWRHLYNIRRAFGVESPGGGSIDDVPRVAALAADVVRAAEAFRAANEHAMALDAMDDESDFDAADAREEETRRALFTALDALQAVRGEATEAER